MGKRNSRSTTQIGDHAFRVVKKDTGHLDYYGPYGTIEGARNKVETITAPYIQLPFHLEVWIEQTPAGWEKVEAA